MKPTPDVVYRYLRHQFNGRIRTGRTPRMATGLQLLKHLRYSPTDLRKLNDAIGISSMGPTMNMRKELLTECVPSLARQHAKFNCFAALFRYFFKAERRSEAMRRTQYCCLKDRPFRKGIYHLPRR